MCIIAYKPAGQIIGRKKLNAMFQNNSDGAGFMWKSASGNVNVKKGFFSYEAFLESYRTMVPKGAEALLHFRIMTAGIRNKKNTHPHSIGHNAYMVHNGHFTFDWTKENPKLSDSIMFGRTLKALPDKWWNEIELLELVEKAVGTYNKVAIMPPGDDEVVIFNEYAGNWHAGVWYSNTSFKDTYFQRTKGFSGTSKPAFCHGGNWLDDDNDMFGQPRTNSGMLSSDVVGMCGVCGNDITEGDFEHVECIYCGHDLQSAFVYTYPTGGEESENEDTAESNDIPDAISERMTDKHYLIKVDKGV